MKRVVAFIIKAGFIILFASIGFVVSQSTNPPQKALAQAASCSTPAQVQGVQLTFPYCDAQGNCDFTQANCTWTALSGASNYQVVIVNSTTGVQVSSQSVASSSSNQVFSVIGNNTYTCTVSAVNSCGTSGPSSSISLLCAVENFITPTVIAPTTPPAATAAPTPPPTGAFENTLLISFGTLALIAGGFILFII